MAPAALLHQRSRRRERQLNSDCWAEIDDSAIFSNNTTDRNVELTYTGRGLPSLTCGWAPTCRRASTSSGADQAGDRELRPQQRPGGELDQLVGHLEEYQAVEPSIRKRIQDNISCGQLGARLERGFSTVSQFLRLRRQPFSIVNRFGRLDTDDPVKLRVATAPGAVCRLRRNRPVDLLAIGPVTTRVRTDPNTGSRASRRQPRASRGRRSVAGGPAPEQSFRFGSDTRRRSTATCSTSPTTRIPRPVRAG
jgi:hypothetical protein